MKTAVACAISFIVGVLFAIPFGLTEGDKIVRLEAVEKGHARFIADRKGKVIFSWNDKLCTFMDPQTKDHEKGNP